MVVVDDMYLPDFAAERGRTVRFQRKMRGGYEQSYLVFTKSDEDITDEEIAGYWPDRFVVQDIYDFVGDPAKPGPAIVYERTISSDLSAMDFYQSQNRRLIEPYHRMELYWVMEDGEFWQLMARLGGKATVESVDQLVAELTKLSVAQVQGFQDALALKLFLLDHPDNAVRMADFVSVDESLYLRCAIVAAGKVVFEEALMSPGSVTIEDFPEYYLAESLLSVAWQAVDSESDLVDLFPYETGQNGRLWGDGGHIGPRYVNYPHRHYMLPEDLDLHWQRCPSGLVCNWPYSGGGGSHFGARFFLKGESQYHEVVVWLFGSALQLGDTEQQVRDFGTALAEERGLKFLDFIELDAGATNYMSPELVFRVRERYLLDS